MAGNINRINRFVLPGGVTVLFLLMIIYPATVYDGAVTGLKTWWNIVFPSLLPFFIISEIMMSLGVVHFLGVIAEPVMRPIFNIPGAGSFAVAVGYASGFPVGAIITSKLRAERLCTRIEAERLLCFTNNSSPLFMLVAVAVGMFNNPGLGFYIAGTHYLANITIGIAMRFYCRNDPEHLTDQVLRPGIFKRALSEFTFVLAKEQRPLGKILGDAVKTSINNLLTIGGFIIFFAVLIMLLTECHVIDVIAKVFMVLLAPFGFAAAVFPALASGVFEMTIGAKLASEAIAPLSHQVIIVAMILGWSGVSILAQVTSMISGTDIRIFPFICTRVAHACLAALYMLLVFKVNSTVPVISNATQNSPLPLFTTGGNIVFCLRNFLFIITGIVALSIAYQFLHYVTNFFKVTVTRRH